MGPEFRGHRRVSVAIVTLAVVLSATFAGVGTVAGDRAGGVSADAAAASVTAVEYSLSAEDGVAGNGTVPDPWRVRQSAGTTEVSTARASDGSKSIHVRGGASLGTSEVAVDVNLTGVSNVTTDVYITRTDTYAGEIQLRLAALGDNQIQGWTLKGEEVWHNDSTANVSAYTGEHTLVFHARGDGNAGYFDDVRFYDESGDAVPLSEVVPGRNTSDGASLSFERSVSGADPANPWSVRYDNGVHNVTSTHPTDGDQSLHLSGNGDLDEVAVDIPVDLSNVAEIRTDAYVVRGNPSWGDLALHVDSVTDNKILPVNGRTDSLGQHTDLSANVTGFTGEHDLIVRARGDNEAYFDNIRFYDSEGRLLSPADVVVGLNDTGPATGDVAVESKGATASASTWGSYNGWESRPSGAIDDVHANHDYAWGATSGAGDWLEVDLDTTYSVDRINVDNGYHSLNYTVEVSTDGSTWEPVAVDHFSPGDHYIDGHRANNDTFELNGTQVRYVRVSILRTNAPSSHIWQAILEEVEVFPASDGTSDALDANFSFTSRPLTAGTTERVNASASSDPDGTITGYAWDFDGDNQTDATGVESSYSFDASGTYEVTLTVFDDEGNAASVTKSVTVEGPAPPEAPPKTGVSTGDPHIITFDGLAYDFQAAGEFTLVREDGGDLLIQARQVPVSDRDVTVNSAVATRLGGQNVTIDATDATPVRVGDTPMGVNESTPLPVGDSLIYYDGTAETYTVVYADDDGTVDAGDTQLVADVVGDRIDVRVHVDPASVGSLSGVLGNADRTRENDLALADGTTLALPLGFDQLYGPFRDSWRVTAGTSLFDYEDGNGPSTYYDPDVPGGPVTLDDFGDAAVADAREKALAAGLENGTVNFRNALIDYLLTNDTSYFESADGAPETPEENLTVPEEPAGNLSGTTVDGFEDADLSEYVDVDTAQTTTETAYAGNRSLVITDQNDDIDTDAQGLIGNTINRTFQPTAPSRLTAAVRADNGAYNTVAVQWKNASGSVIHSAKILNYYDTLYYGGTDDVSLEPVTGHTWYYVELLEIDWDANVVGEIRVNGQTHATNVSFLHPADSVSEVRLVAHDGATGSVGYFDEVTVGGANTTDDAPADGPVANLTADASTTTAGPGDEFTVSYTLGNDGNEDGNATSVSLDALPAGWEVNSTSGDWQSTRHTWVTLDTVAAGGEYTANATVSVPANASEGAFGLGATGYVAPGVSDTANLTVDVSEFSVLQYDTDGDGTVSGDFTGALGAIADYNRGEITQRQVIRVLAAFNS